MENRLKNIIVAFLVIAAVAVAALFGAQKSIHVAFHHMDGAFQTASGLFRLSDGQVPGKDFFPYLGLGLLYALYPLFEIKGGTLAGSIFSVWSITALANAFSVGLIGAILAGALYSRCNRLLVGALTGTLFLFLGVHYFAFLPAEIVDRFSPGNSLRPLRAFAPYLSAALVYWAALSSISIQRKPYLMAGIAGIAFVWSNDYGLPTWAITTAFALGYARAHKIATIRKSIAILTIAITAPLLLMTILTAGNPFPLLHHSFVNVARDQYWYFASWFGDFKIFTFSDIYDKSISPYVGWWALLPAALSVQAAFRRSLEYSLLACIGVGLASGALTASIGGHVESGYWDAYIFWCKATLILAVLLPVVVSQFHGVRLAKTRLRFLVVAAICLVTALPLIALIAEQRDLYRKLKQEARIDPDKFYVRELGGFIPKDWEKHIQLIQRLHNEPAVEEYWGLWSSMSPKRGFFPADAVIHALGTLRGIASNRINQYPQYVMSSSKGIAGHWLSWNISANWWFYRPLMERYSATQTSPTTLLWERNQIPNRWLAVGCEVQHLNGAPTIVVLGKEAGYFEITLQYNADRFNTRYLLMVQNNMNFANGIDGFMAIDPRATSATFPAAIFDPVNDRLHFKLVARANKNLNIDVQACQARKINFQHPDVLPPIVPIAPYHTANLTDKDWIQGVSRIGNAVLLDSATPETSSISVGQKIKFFDGLLRTVVAREVIGKHIKLTLEGWHIEGFSGYPHLFTLEPV